MNATKVVGDCKGKCKSLADIWKIYQENTKKLGGADTAEIFKNIVGSKGMQGKQ